MLVCGIVFAVAVLMFVAELIFKGRKWPQVTSWWGRALLLNAIQVASVFLAATSYDHWLKEQRPWSADGLGTAPGIILGYLVLTFIYYWWHRWRHEVDFLWLWFHQVHHSPQRIEIITSFYKHPFEIIINSILSSAILYILVGLSPENATYVVLITGLAELFYHWNVPTPYWLGFFFQRPESHCVHHQTGHHKQNFSDLPLWDMLFGTFHNPKAFEAQCGFSDDRELKLGVMLQGKDVHKEEL